MSDHVIGRTARGAVLNWFSEKEVSPKKVLEQMNTLVGFGDERDLATYIRERHGDDLWPP